MAKRRYVEGPFGQVHLREAGSRGTRPTLVCLHMSPMSGRTFETFIDALAREGRHAIAVDTPGFGMSDAPASRPAIEDYTRSLLATLDALGMVGAVDLMGYHTGSMIACETALTAPARVRRLVLVSAPIFTHAELDSMRAEYAPNPARADGGHLLHRWLRFSKYYGEGGMTLAQIADAFPDGLLGREIEWWGHAAAFAYPPGMRLAEVMQPVLLLNPDDDLRDFTLRAPGLLQNGREVRLDGWGHGFLDVHTAEVAALVGGFLDEF